MHGICFDHPLQDWFDHKVPQTSIDPDFIVNSLTRNESPLVKPAAKIVWLGTKPSLSYFTKSKKGKQWEMAELTFYDKKSDFSIQFSKEHADWLVNFLPKITPETPELFTFQKIKEDFESNIRQDFEPFWYSKAINTLRQSGLLVL